MKLSMQSVICWVCKVSYLYINNGTWLVYSYNWGEPERAPH